MLVLTRKANESIQLGKDIRITVLAIDPERVRIGISAPCEMNIYRTELLDETRDTNKEAAAAQLPGLSIIGKLNNQKHA